MKIDIREAKDIEKEIEELAASYTPEWRYDTEDPDIGSVLAKIFSSQMEENIGLLNNVTDRNHAEFVNMLDLSLKPAKPSSSMVKFGLIENTVAGVTIRKGLRLVSQNTGEDGMPVVFETDREIYATNAKITDAFMTDREAGSIVPLLGDFMSARVLEEEEESRKSEGEDSLAEEEPSGTVLSGPKEIRPFVLFSEEGNIARYVLIMYHETIFDIEGESIFIRISGNRELTEKIEAGKFRFSYYTDEGFLEFDSVSLLPDGETFSLIKNKPNKKTEEGGKQYAVVILEAKEPVSETCEVRAVEASSAGSGREADYVTDGNTDLKTESFAPFGDTLSIYNECYVGSDLYFSQAGATVTLTFRLNSLEKGLYLTKQEEQTELKIIKRKPRTKPQDNPAQAWADEIALEYFNGIGWKQLPCEGEIGGILRGETAADVKIRFNCPSDWISTETGAYSGRCIRIRLMKSDNCYLRPAVHHYPVIKDLTIEYSYEDRFMIPQKLYTITGTRKRDITSSMGRNREFVVFSGGDYKDDTLYLGFDRRPEEGPVTLYFEVDDIVTGTGLKCTFEYSSMRGFRKIRMVDYTHDFSHSGLLMFMPPSDMHEASIEGRRRFWLRIRREKPQNDQENVMFLPRINRIMLNVVGVLNIVTGSEENFYVDEPGPDMRFALNGKNILDAEVWVNEHGVISREETEKMLSDSPELIKAEYDRLGRTSAVYVKWREADTFWGSEDRRCYQIDRVSGEIVFSDGIKADYPRVTDDVAFKVRIRSTDGKHGNVPAGSISAVSGTEIFIDSVVNPVQAYGGTALETIREAMRRGANVINGRGRLVTERDYVWTILNYSDSIDKAALVAGETIDGINDPADLSFVLLMKDYKEGSFSFHRISGGLKEHLIKTSSITISPERIHIVEPVFVDVSVNVWAEVEDPDDSFEVRQIILDTFEEFFDPVSHKTDSGWNIGTMPKPTQVMMKLSTVSHRAVIRRMSMTAHYVDKDGEHETALSDLKVSPFMTVRSGVHQVNIEMQAG